MDEYNEKRTDTEERPALARTWKKLRRYAVKIGRASCRERV